MASPYWFWFFLLLVLGSQPARASENGPDAGFFFDRFSLTLEKGSRTEAAGPFFYAHTNEMSQSWALPPLFSRMEWPEVDAVEYDIAYPVLTYDRFGGEYRWQLGQLLSFSGGQSQSEISRDRFTIFPFYFQQRSAESNQNYTALFPIYGHLKNRIFRSEIDFILWPLYVKTVKRPSAGPAGDDLFLSGLHQWLGARRGDVTTHNFLLPFFHLRYGDGLFGWQAWPLLGHEHKAVSTKTNSWGDAEQIPGHDKRFYLWPLFFNQHREIGSANPEKQLLLFPLYNQMRSPLRDSTSYLTPFGLTLTDDRARKYREIGAPWPLIAFARGEGKTLSRVWPFFGRGHNAGLAKSFYLWPLYTYKRIHGESLDRHRTRLLYFLGSHTVEQNTASGATKTRTDVWPLFTHQRDFAGRTRLQILAPLEPILPASKSIERNYSPLWSVWVAENNPQTGARSQSLLWNLYRREVVPALATTAPPRPASSAPKGNLFSFFAAESAPTLSPSESQPPPSASTLPTPPTKNVSLLFGLFQYESSAETKGWRLFYLPLKKSQKVSDHVPEHR